MTGRAASGPRAPRPSTALPSVAMATELPLAVSAQASDGRRAMALATAAHPGRVGQGQVLAGAHGHPRCHFDLAAQVVEERPVRDVADPAVGALQGGGDGGHVLLAGGLKGEVHRRARRRHLDQVHAHDDGADRTDGLARAAAAGPGGVRRHPDGDRVAGARRPGRTAVRPWAFPSLDSYRETPVNAPPRPNQHGAEQERSDGLGDEG